MQTPRKEGWRRKGLAGPVALLAAALALAACGEAGGGADPPHRITVPTGTELRLTLDQELGPAGSGEGDRFTARVAEPVTVDGRVAIPRGAVLHGYVLGVEERAGGGELSLRLGFQTIRVRGGVPILSARLLGVRPEVRAVTGDPAERAGKAAGRIGTVLGGSGLATGAGSSVVLATPDARAVLPRGSELRIELTGPIRVRTP